MNEPELHTAVIGGGLAGLAAAEALSRSGVRVTLIEARQQLGGRAGSYQDRTSGETIDNCQHVSMGCCTNLRHFCEQLGLGQTLLPVEQLNFVSPSGRVTTFRADPLPAPLHLLRSFARLDYLTLSDRRRFATAARQLAAAAPDRLRGMSFIDWLREHGQSERLISLVWEVVLVSALSESLDRIDAAYARKVFVDGFLCNREGWRVEIPTLSLDEMYSQRTAAVLKQRGVQIHPGTRLQRLTMDEQGMARVLWTDGARLPADDVILAVPQHQLDGLLPETPQLAPLRQQASAIETAPISSLHLWLDRPITDLPHAVLVGRLSQWLFARGECAAPGGGSAFLYQIVISASRQLVGLSPEAVCESVCGELAEVWPAMHDAQRRHFRLITEKRAVFSVLPGIDAFRPPQQTEIANLQLAGDWTATGWPATMEGAVRSGYRAAENLLRRHGRAVSYLQPDLPRSRWARWLLRLPD